MSETQQQQTTLPYSKNLKRKQEMDSPVDRPKTNCLKHTLCSFGEEKLRLCSYSFSLKLAPG